MIFRALEAALLPPRCVFCGAGTRDSALCRDCHDDLPWLGPACPRCARPLGRDVPRGACCEACRVRAPPLDATLAPLAYAFPIDAALKALKFRRRLHYAPVFAELLMATRPRLPDDIDALLPVPLHWRRRVTRGFNQAEELAAPLGRAWGLPLLRGVRRMRATRAQAGLAAGARRRNLADAFRVQRPLGCDHVLIVDDVITTGTTVAQLARCLRAAGVASVSALAVARAG